MIILLASFGLTNIVFTSRWRPNHKPFNCYKCLGFWSGSLCYLVTHLGEKFGPYDLMYAFAGSAVAVMLSSLLDYLEHK